MGVAIGGVTVLIIIGIGLLWYWRRKRARSRSAPASSTTTGETGNAQQRGWGKPELDGNGMVPKPEPNELSAERDVAELYCERPVELDAGLPPELDTRSPLARISTGDLAPNAEFQDARTIVQDR